MITLAPGVALYLATAPTDMRKGFDGLLQVVAEHVRKNVLDGELSVFFNKRRDRVKLLWWQEGGLCIWYQRLERGTFELPKVAAGAKSVWCSRRPCSVSSSGGSNWPASGSEPERPLGTFGKTQLRGDLANGLAQRLVGGTAQGRSEGITASCTKRSSEEFCALWRSQVVLQEEVGGSETLSVGPQASATSRETSPLGLTQVIAPLLTAKKIDPLVNGPRRGHVCGHFQIFGCPAGPKVSVSVGNRGAFGLSFSPFQPTVCDSHYFCTARQLSNSNRRGSSAPWPRSQPIPQSLLALPAGEFPLWLAIKPACFVRFVHACQ